MTDSKKEDIFRAGRKVFLKKGFKKTGIAEIAQAAQIAVGTFYNFYSSKEELFVELYLHENEGLKKKLLADMDYSLEPVQFAVTLLNRNIKEMNANRILSEWYNKELFKKLEKHFLKHNGIKNLEEYMNQGKLELIELWKSQNKIRSDISTGMINALFNAIPYLDIHKQEIGLEYFPDILFLVTEFIMQGISVR